MTARRRPLLVLLAIVLAMFAAMQFFTPERSNPPVDPSRTIQAHVTVPSEVQAVLERSCNDCHSHETRWPWYSRVAPASWLLAYDVREGRGEMNLSEWASYAARDADHLLEEVCEMVRDGEMPLRPYTWVHPRAKLAPGDVERLCAWTDAARAEIGHGAENKAGSAPDEAGTPEH